ncbi:hypothetical protein HELRODRAFT_96017 [Helobdella robusta]|uniref:Caspase family p20 domain-containing protein n=1 Tax=Helobdella robusta TaxID=6412 RepID=T1G998_HELRO|nr:hypothetical protein HELRODRAFT_96017 [Helobdella robusta]ESN92712.1 hypothetical protein HELRODRAFT_96017 [Helobdella robusta]
MANSICENLKLEEYNFKSYSIIGKCIIINNEHFHEKTGQSNREGTEIDARNADNAFRRLGFEVTLYNDLSWYEMRNAIQEAAGDDYGNYACLVVVILSHGREGKVYATDGTLQIDSEVVDKFKGENCQSLAGKPKLFFIQACRGSKFDHGVEMRDYVDGVSVNEVRIISSEADIMIAHSSTAGFYSWRNNVDGSWFIESLCNVLNSDLVNDVDLVSLMTLVNKLVSDNYQSKNTDEKFSSNKKQIPCVLSTLRKLVFLRPRD